MTRLLLVAVVAVLAAGMVSGAGAERDMDPGAGTLIQDATCGTEPGDTSYMHEWTNARECGCG